ncbi:biotin transporter BioY [Bdellovibrio sp. HCB290]|uniref:biotin transporter BioY n=1 Tax=Bdellovibrio sp. HCB290 TaxID=3394356 RepID=UPI0039B63940
MKAPIPLMISSRIENPVIAEVLAILAGSLLMALLAQISFYLPFTPVPVTGQTFGVSLLALLWGRKRAVASFMLYLTEGYLGLPVFAHGQAFLQVGPTLGYLVGMLPAIWIVGGLADRRYPKTFLKALVSCYLGSMMIFLFGLAGLSYFVPSGSLIATGLLPFLPGDLIKNILASAIALKMNAYAKK